MLYTDHMIYSPNVPWFRTRSRDAPNDLFYASVITAPAPNASQAERHGESIEQVNATLVRRSGQVLALAKSNGHKNLILGAWGCGVFGNDPLVVANAFKEWLNAPEFTSAFETVIFAVFDKSKDKRTYHAFRETLERPSR